MEVEKPIVHQNDLYGNISKQEEHEQRYDTKIVDTNQYYDDYDNAELKWFKYTSHFWYVSQGAERGREFWLDLQLSGILWKK